MSPERCEGEAGDHRADIYGHGLPFALSPAGRTPYQHSNPVALLKAQHAATITFACRITVPPAISMPFWLG